MIRNIVVEPLYALGLAKSSYDVFLATIGYERRARFIAETFSLNSSNNFASAFQDNQVLDFEKNRQWFSKAGFNIQDVSEEDFYVWCRDLVSNISSQCVEEVRLLIDISSMSRQRIAAVVAALAFCAARSTLRCDFVYSLAKYTAPPKSMGPITKMGPVLPEFAGWFDDPGAPCSAVIGLGYDLGKSVGTIEYLEPGEIWVFNPIGEDARYGRAVLRANEILLDVLDKERMIDYEVTRPFEAFNCLQSFLSGIARSRRPVIVPFGPKIFSLCAILSAIIEHPKVSVWRVSSGKYEQIANRIASGTVVGLSARFTPNESDVQQNGMK